jgi:hypothetical protein
MSDHFDPLEQELAGLAPREPSPELVQRIGGELNRSRMRIRSVVLVAGLIAVVVLLMWAYRELTRPIVVLKTWPPPPATAPVDYDSQPTLQAYRRAIGRSPEEFDALLDKQAAVAGGESTSLRAFSRREFVSIGEP